jgi:hypothetical protein
VFEALVHGQPDTTLISLDEFWARELARLGRLERITDFACDRGFLGELMESCAYGGDHWAVPHFTDFSYYTCRKKNREELAAWLNELGTATEANKALQLRKQARSGRLLVYDFHTPDTVACVVLEFIQAFGDGVGSLLSGSECASPRNVRAIQILRGMVGDRGPSDFAPGEPMNFDSECARVLFTRDWHMRYSDMPETCKTHEPILRCRIPGTLGGWHVGMLAPAFSRSAGLEGLGRLLTKANQLQRLTCGGGLPTLAEFYKPENAVRYHDPITGWSLEEVREYMKSLIRRSGIQGYLQLRPRLIDLHYTVMSSRESDTEKIFRAWAVRVANDQVEQATLTS